MSAQAMVLEFGMGVDVHGEEGTKAACRAVSDAIRHSSLPLFTEVRAKGGRMLVDKLFHIPTQGHDIAVERRLRLRRTINDGGARRRLHRWKRKT